MSTSPVDIARYVVQRDGDEPEHNLTVAEADRLDLARAVIDLTAKVELRDKALDAVLELHKPIQASMTTNSGVIDTTVCAHCLDPAWPCATVATITTAIGEDHA